ncbi:MAG: hypothetical protein IKT78_02860 [Ruminiclostridium sp.]|nr:hypothetical protein [Ruminiclostridium sp.]
MACSKKPALKKEIIFLIGLALVWASVLVVGILSRVSQRRNDFMTTYYDHFENIRSVVEENGDGRYIIGDVLYYRYLDSDDEYISRKISLTDAQRESMNIIYNPNNMFGVYFSDITVTSAYVMFYDERSGCGVMYTEDIKAAIDEYNRGLDRFSYDRLGDNWYEIDD